MAELKLAKRVHDKLVRHLEEIKVKKEEIIERYYPSKTPERKEFTEFLEDYIYKVDMLIKGSSQADKDDELVPMSVIGSTVSVHDMESGEEFNFLIVFPEDFKLEGDDVSLFSPLGKGLILKNIGDIAEIKAPAGIIRYKIVSVKLDL